MTATLTPAPSTAGRGSSARRCRVSGRAAWLVAGLLLALVALGLAFPTASALLGDLAGVAVLAVMAGVPLLLALSDRPPTDQAGGR